MARGFGVTATRDLELARQVARAVERLGYDSVWTNDVPAADGLDVAGAMAEATSRVRVGVGVLACDGRAPEEVAQRVVALGLPLERMLLGIGSGRSRSVALVRRALTSLRGRLGPAARFAVGAMGPRMCALAGDAADVVLLNWMGPERLVIARGWVEGAAKEKGRRVKIAAYVRAAIGSDAAARIAAEAERYGRMPQYARHSDASATATVGIALDGGDANALFAPYEAALDETVVRALPESEDVESIVAIARACAPRGSATARG